MENPASFISDRLQTVSVPARKLFDVIVREAYHGPLHPKPEGTATPPEILEACGLDVGEFYTLLEVLKEAGLIGSIEFLPVRRNRTHSRGDGSASLRDAS